MKSREQKNQSSNDLNQFSATSELFEKDQIDLIEKIDAFPRYASRQSIAKFFTKYEIFKKIVNINGSIVECGVLHGAGTLSWAKLSSIFEPVNHTRKIIGFDTFEGFVDIHDKDKKGGTSSHFKTGGLTGLNYDDVQKGVEVYDLNRPLNHIEKVELIKGDLCVTAPKYVEENPHLVVSLLYLDVDLYEPTLKALEVFYPRMPKGSIIVFDELNAKMFPGETRAVEEFLGFNNIKIERFPFDSYVSYCVV
ncbi:MAG: dTDP-6-deoxy-L-hexose 3-O-methyltransferase [Denitrovibrio sp.]|nr:MAG: dTDP-6-deoxy-L-hexose 3-O-methyltransferase [Denitrovibrio sp.]